MFAVLIMTIALAQEPARSAERFELADAYRTAEERSPQLVAARALATAARSRVASTRRPPDPQLQIGIMNYSVPDLRPMDPIGMTQIQVMQMLPVAGQLRLASRVSGFAADAQAERSRESQWEVRSRVAMAFYDLYATERLLAIDRTTLRLLQDVLATAEAMYRVGEGRQADVLRAQVEIARMVEDTIRMTTMRDAMAARLASVLDLPPGARVQSPVLPAFPDSVPALEMVQLSAAESRPMLRAGARDLDAATAQVALARREIWPDLTLGVQYGQRAGMEGTDRMMSFMIGGSLPLFAGSRQLRMRDEMSAMQQMARADLDAMRATTRATVAEAHSGLLRARRLGALYRSTLLPQWEAALASAAAAYRVGNVDFMTLLDSRMSVNSALKAVAQLEAEEGKAWADLEMLTGQQMFVARSAPETVARRSK